MLRAGESTGFDKSQATEGKGSVLIHRRRMPASRRVSRVGP